MLTSAFNEPLKLLLSFDCSRRRPIRFFLRVRLDAANREEAHDAIASSSGTVENPSPWMVTWCRRDMRSNENKRPAVGCIDWLGLFDL
jgi:hypothetical protein